MLTRILSPGTRAITRARRHLADFRALAAMQCRHIALASVGACVIAGCAPQRLTTQVSAPATSPAPAVAKTIAPAPAVAVATKRSPKSYSGYRARQKNGATVYCKTIARTGSRFEDEYCMSAEELDWLELKAEEDRQHFRQNQTICGVGVCGDGK